MNGVWEGTNNTIVVSFNFHVITELASQTQSHHSIRSELLSSCLCFAGLGYTPQAGFSNGVQMDVSSALPVSRANTINMPDFHSGKPSSQSSPSMITSNTMTFAVALCRLFLCVLSSPVPQLQNITVSVPEGTTNHGDPRLLCFPTKSWDIILFFLGNYVAHAATIIAQPGQTLIMNLVARLSAFFVPFAGIPGGLWYIYCAAWREKIPLQKAHTSAALCEVVRALEWRPKDGDIIQDLKVSVDPEELFKKRTTPEDRECRPIVLRANVRTLHKSDDKFQPAVTWYSFSRYVHGRCMLPKGYTLARFPPAHRVEEYPTPRAVTLGIVSKESLHQRSENQSTDSEIACSYIISKPLVAIIQLIYGSLTIYRTRGDQVKQYGYAAFGLTVTPYIIMSFVNLCASLLAPSYSHMYLVSSDVSEEAQRRDNAVFEGMVGTAGRQEDVDENGSRPGRFTGIFEVSGDRYRLRPYYKSVYEPESAEDNDLNIQESFQEMVHDANFAIVEFSETEEYVTLTIPRVYIYA